MRTNTIGAAAAALLTAVLSTAVLTGCSIEVEGGSKEPVTKPPASVAAKPAGLASRPPAEILRQAEAALRGASSFRATAKDVDLQVNRSGVKGWLRQDGLRVDLVIVGGRVYFRGRKFWTAQDPEVGRFLGDAWVDVTGGGAGDVEDLADYLSVKGFADSFKTDVVHKHRFTQVSERTIDGVRVVRLTGQGATLDVAATGSPYPLRFDSSKDDEDLTLTAFGRPVTITAPKDAVTPPSGAKG
jgi:hypothetical protein